MKTLTIFLGFCIATSALAQSTTPATQEIPSVFKIIITGVEGIAQSRATPDEPWKKAVVGMELIEGAELRTGPRSAVRFVIPPDQTVTLDRYGTLQILEANFRDGKIMTDLGMKYGRVRYEIEAATREHDAKVRTPASTLAVRGTQVTITDQPPFPPEAISLTGRAQFRDAHKQIAFGGKGAGKTVIRTDKDSPADVSLSQSYVDPSINYARTPAEQRLIEQVFSQGGVLSFDAGNGIPVVRGGTPPSADRILANPPGGLTFVLRWTGNADLDLSVGLLELQEIVAPVYPLNHSASGGKTLFDHRGGKNGGIEVVFWSSDFPGHLIGINDDKSYASVVRNVSNTGTAFDLDVLTIDDSKVPVRDPTIHGFAQPQPPASSIGSSVAAGRKPRR